MIAVIPAGGKATRFMGIHKDMLPVGNDQFLLSSAMDRARAMGARRCVIVTSSEKAALHERFLANNDSLLVSSSRGLWGAIRESFHFWEESILVLPDTLFTIDQPVPDTPFALGTFVTNEPSRFSILVNGVIITKPGGIVQTPQQAWGCAYWNKDVIDLWRERHYADYDEAFNAALYAFGCHTFAIQDYQDFGDWASYKRHIQGLA
jgi:hypothetical protein